MREFTIAEVVSAVKGRLICGSGDGSVLKVCTDSRLAKPGDLFFPLIGEKTTGMITLHRCLREDVVRSLFPSRRRFRKGFFCPTACSRM